MSALDLIAAYLMMGYEDVTEGYKKKIEPQVRQEAQELYNAVAHELAEKIRADKCGSTSPDGVLCSCGAAAADLIDPEVSDSGA